MSAKKKPPTRLNLPFEEALKRFIHTDPKELDDALDATRQKQEEIRRNVEQRRESINSGPWRITKKPSD